VGTPGGIYARCWSTAPSLSLNDILQALSDSPSAVTIDTAFEYLDPGVDTISQSTPLDHTTGHAVIQQNLTISGNLTASVTIDGVDIQGSPAHIDVLPGTPNPGTSTFAISANTSAAGQAITALASLVDTYGNAVATGGAFVQCVSAILEPPLYGPAC
jgi:hypothetical protein